MQSPHHRKTGHAASRDTPTIGIEDADPSRKIHPKQFLFYRIGRHDGLLRQTVGFFLIS